MGSQDTQRDALADGSSAGHAMPGDVNDVPGQETLSEISVELPAYLGLLNDLPPTPSYDLPEDELCHIPEGTKESSWQNCLNSVEKYDRELCQTYREQIDTLLVFAGLFSAVVTAFAVESYQWLQDDPLDTSVELLRDMVTLLSQSLNATAPHIPVSPSQISGPVVARINCFWFLSLSLSLSAALVGILCKQWLREYERNVGQSPEMALEVRFIRFRGLEYWKVGSIVMSVPIILQVALAFFMIGVIELLWRLHAVVACCVTVVAALTLLFFLATTFLPAIQYAYICVRCCIRPLEVWKYCTTQAFTEPQCAFKSPQAWLVFRIIQPAMERLIKTYGHHFSLRRPPHIVALVLRPADSWVTFDINWIERREHIHYGPRCAFISLGWIAENLGDMHMRSWIWHCVWSRWLRNRSTPASIDKSSLDIGAVARTYPRIVALDYNISPQIRAQALVFRCSLHPDLPVETAIELFIRLAPVVGVDSQWTHEAARAIAVVFQHLSYHISDGLAVRLFRIAEMQTNAVLVQSDRPNSSTRLAAALAFKDILLIISRGSGLRNSLLAAMSGLALQWLRTDPPTQVALVARSVLGVVIRYLETRALQGDDWGHFPGTILIARLADAAWELWPEYLRQHYMSFDNPYRPPVLRGLLAMLSGAYGDIARSSQSGTVSDADGERSNAPRSDAHSDPHVGEDVDRVQPGPIAQTGVISPIIGPDYLRIDVQGLSAETEITPIGINGSASPPGSPVRPQSPRGSPTSL